MSIRAKSYFAGAGLLDLGIIRAGITVVQSFELDEKCCATQRSNFDHEVVQCDITKKLALEEADAELKLGTYPCQKYSGAGFIHGVCTGDELYLHFFRHLALDAKLEAYVLENVPGMKRFPVVMEAMTKLPGFHVQIFCPVQSSTWLPQRRDRLILFGTRRPFNFRLPEKVRAVSLAEIIEHDPRVEIPEYVGRRLRGNYRDRPIVSDPERGDIAPTCVAHYAKDVSTRLVADKRFPGGARPYSVREYARLQGVPDDFKFVGSDRDAYRMIGNGVSVPVGEWIGRELVRYFKTRGDANVAHR